MIEPNFLQIVMTPVRNEAWCLKAFLNATSLWADYIIIADQMSTDGSREIAKDYPKVILIDNPSESFNEDGRQALLIAKAREVAAGRDCLLWGLDADEILSANFRETEDWQKILNSKPGDVFWFKWANINPDLETYSQSKNTYYPWLFHDDGKEPHKNYVRNMHSMRIPYPIEEKSMYYIDDFRVLHLDKLNKSRAESKKRYYTFVDWEMNHQNPIKLSRSYNKDRFADEESEKLPESYIYTNENDGFDLFSDIHFTAPCHWMDDYVLSHLANHPLKETQRLDIWDSAFSAKYGKDPRSVFYRLVHDYLHRTSNKATSFVIKGTDKLVILFCK